MHTNTASFPDPASAFADTDLISGFDLLPQPVIESTVFAMNTAVSYKVSGANAQESVASALAEIARLENLLSRFRPGSDIHRLNQAPAGSPVSISPETALVLAQGIRLNELTDGYFNMLVGPLVDLWNFKHASAAPEEIRIKACLELVNAGQPVVTSHSNACLASSGQSVDLGGIAKGYAGDRCLEMLKQYGIRSAFFNFGGNVAALGCRPDGTPWQVGIRHPRLNDRLLGAVEVVDQSVVTSGDYERFFFDQSGARCHHLLNPSTGYPARSGLISATVISADGMIADTLSTAIFIAGRDKALQILSHFPDVEAILVDEDQRILITSGLIPRFSVQEEIQIEML